MKIAPIAIATPSVRSTSDAGHLRGKSKGADFLAEFSKAESSVGKLDTVRPSVQAGPIANPSDNNLPLAVNYPASFSRQDSAPFSPGSGAGASNSEAIHTVKHGETLYGITRKVLEGGGLEATPQTIMRSLSRLSEYNGIKDPNRIHSGQAINFSVLIDSMEKSTRVPVQTLTEDMSGELRSIVGDVKNMASSLTIVKGAIDSGVAYTQPTAAADSPVRNLEVTETNPAKNGSISSRYAPLSLSESAVNVVSLSAGRSDIAPIFDGDGIAMKDHQPARAEKFSTDPAKTSDLSDLMYKGAFGKALDYLPIQTEDRVAMQQAGSVVNGMLTGIKLSGLLNIATPAAAVLGFLWGVFSAKNIAPADNTKPPQ